MSKRRGNNKVKGIKAGDPREVFELEESLGEGSYGEVFKARFADGKTEEKVAVKIIPIDDELSELEKEVEILNKTKDDFIVDFVGAWHDAQDDRIWIVMELCVAGSVNDVIHICHMSLEEDIIRVITASVLLGLSYLHSNRMIHRDIKAGNILLTDKGQAKLADFGVSAQLESEEQKRKTVIGTPFWMSPEVISESTYDGKADVWSLGISIIEMAEMEPPYSNIHPMRAIFMIPSRPPPKLQHPDDFSPEMNDFLALCLQKDPNSRPTADELMDHPFVKQAVQDLETAHPRGYSHLIEELVEENIELINQVRIEEAAERAMGKTSTTGSGTRGNTAVWEEHSTSSEKWNGGHATLQEDIDSGTLVAANNGNKTSIFTPGNTTKSIKPAPFMAYFQSTKKKSDKRLEDDMPTLPATSKEMIELTTRLQNLDVQFQRDVQELRKAYDQRREALMNAADAS